MKKTLCALLLSVSSLITHAQLTNYSSYDVEYDAAASVEDMTPDEIRTYNDMILNGCDTDAAVMLINAGRAQDNLIAAPPTIIELHCDGEITDADSLPEYKGATAIWVEVINTTPKNIREMTLTFSFSRYDSPMYNIKDGSKYCVLTFNNLKGRTKSNRYTDISNSLFDTFFIGGLPEASKVTPFYNSKADKFMLEKVFIRYSDGTTTNKAAIWNRGVLDEKLSEDGPLKPITKLLKKDSKK